jgi:hypothetical protein
MSSLSTRSFVHAFKAAAVAAALVLTGSPGHAQGSAQAAAGPFEDFAGSWSGTGTVSLSNGTNERIRCRASYHVTEAGRLLSQDLRCASDSYKFELQTTVAHQGGSISGTWNETTRSVVGSISGRISGGTIQAQASSAAVSANLSVVTRGNQQSVTIQSPGSEVSEVSITLRRGSR